MRSWRCLLIAIPLILLTAAPAVAKVGGAPVKVRLAGEPGRVRPFETCAGMLEIVAARDVTLEGLTLGGKGLTRASAAKSAAGPLAAGAALAVPFTLVPTEAEPGLVATVTAEGHVYELPVDLAAARREWEEGAVTPLAPDDLAAVKDLRWPTRRGPRPPAADDPGWTDDGPGDGAGVDKSGDPAAKARTITVSGQLKYFRADDALVYPEGIPFAVWDEDYVYDDKLAEGVTGPGGFFEVTFGWDPCGACEDDPDIYVEFITMDDDVDVQTSWLEWTYAFPTYVVDDYQGTDLDFGTLNASTNQQLLHIFLNLRRAFDRYAIAGYDLGSIDLQYDGVSSYYDPYFEEIHLLTRHRWDESAYWHELGHHWANRFADFFNPLVDYCNGTCDEGAYAPLCTHCMWCAETQEVAELEAQAHFCSWLMGEIASSVYDPPPAHVEDVETIDDCWDTVEDRECGCEPTATEGFVAAFLIDLADDDNEDDPATPGYADVLSLNAWDVLLVDDERHNHTVGNWWTNLKTYFPDIVPQMWETGMNAGYDFDTEPPSDVANLRSTSHTVREASPDATIAFAWDGSVDDASGIEGYCITVTENAPGPAGSYVDTPYPGFTTAPLPTGNWYVNVRAKDVKGNLSPNTVSLGPFVVRQPYPSDLHLQDSRDWPLEVVATTSQSSTTGGPPLPAVLRGWQNTYWHYQGINEGEAAIPETMTNFLVVDGERVDANTLAGGSPNLTFSFKNRGPVVVPGGRHCFGVELDGLEVVPETVETNNGGGFQWVWSPFNLAEGTAYNRTAPGWAVGGWEDAGAYVYNCDGYRFFGSIGFNAVYAYTWSDTADYDVRLHEPSTGSTHGFQTVEAWSARPPGLLDAVIVNGNQTGAQDWDVGVLNGWDADAGFTIRHVGGIGVPIGGPMPVTMAHGEHLVLLQFHLADAADGALSLVVDAGPGAPPLHVGWLDANTVTGTLLDARRTVASGDDGVARMDIDAERTGYHGLVVWREPADGAGEVPLTVSVIPTPADIAAVAPAGWCAPLVPRPYHANTPYVVSVPDTLHGNTFAPAGTFLCLAADNLGPADASAVPSRVLLDGKEFETYEWYALLSGIPEKRFLDTPRRVRGGRHTLTLVLDDPDTVDELDEGNNVYGSQWVWSPLELAYGVNTYRPAPPPALGGVETVGGLLGVVGRNCDGLRMPAPDPVAQPGTWQGLAVLPGDTTIVDPVLYEAAPGVLEGFDDQLTMSFWGPGQTDFILVDNGLTPRRAFDVGVQLREGAQGYHARVVNSVDLGSAPAGRYGPVGLGQLEILHLYECELPEGPAAVTLRSVSGAVDWGLALYRSGGYSGNEPWLGRHDALTYAHVWLAGPGEDETFDVHVTAGRYCLAVFRKEVDDLQEAGVYELVFGEGIAGHPPAAAAAPGIVSVRPNPFNPRTTVVFDVAAAGEAIVEVYDVRGRLVRTLAVPTPAGGRYEAVWDGLDQGGRSCASGSYFLRLRAGGRTVDLAKGVLVR